MTNEELDALEAMEKAATVAPWSACRKGKCPCKQVWCADHPVAEIVSGEWGDDFCSVRVVGETLERKVEAFMDQITYGSVDKEFAEANAELIAALRNAAPALISSARERDRLRAELETLRARLGDISEFECGHGVKLTEPCEDCGAGSLVIHRA